MSNLFKLEKSPGNSVGLGTMFSANSKSFPALRKLSMQSFHLPKGGIRTPHLHPDAAQLDYLVSGSAKVGIVGPDGPIIQEMEAGDVCFVPLGHLHWIQNTGNDELHFILTLSNENPQTIEFETLVNGVSVDVAAQTVGVSLVDWQRISKNPP